MDGLPGDQEMKKTKFSTYRLVFIALFAAIVLVCTLVSVPVLESKVHFGNTASILAGLILSPVDAGLAAGLGSMLYDATLGGYDAIGCGITFVSKYLMAFVCALLMRLLRKREYKEIGKRAGFVYAISAVAALTYVALYMLKTFVMKQVVDGLTIKAVWVVMIQKLPASLINAAFATFAAPPLYAALLPALNKIGIMAKLK